MLKRISVEQLKPGMHLHELCGSWMSHPFWRKSFVLNDPKDIRRILDSGIQEVWIDSDKGIDVDFGETKAEVEAQINDDLSAAAASAAAVPAPAVLSDEIRRAAKICAKSKRATISRVQETRMGKIVESASALEIVDDISASVLRNPRALISIARLKRADEYTYMHSVAVSGLMLALAKQLDLGEQRTREAGLAGLLHDVGKTAIPLEVLNKPGKLTDAEFTVMKSHPEEGYRILCKSPGIADAVLYACRHHHEKLDASGYPQGLGGDDIDIIAKMAAVCDVYDAITSDRPYRKGWDPAEAVRKMAEWSHSHFEITVFQAFVKVVGIYPVGTLVRLQSGHLGVVLDQSGQTLLTPKVKVFFSLKSQLRLKPEIVDLARPGSNNKILARENPDNWDFPDLELLWRDGDPQSW